MLNTSKQLCFDLDKRHFAYYTIENTAGKLNSIIAKETKIIKNFSLLLKSSISGKIVDSPHVFLRAQ